MCHQATWTRWCMITLIAFRWHSRICVPSNVIDQYLFISKCIPVRLALILDVFLNWAHFSAWRRGMCIVWRYQLIKSTGQYSWRHLVAKFWIDAGGATWFELNVITEGTDSIAWVYFAEGNVYLLKIVWKQILQDDIVRRNWLSTANMIFAIR